MMENLAVFFDEDVLATSPPMGLFERAPSPLLANQTLFTESPQRIENIKSVLERGPSASRFVWYPGRKASDAEILTYHTQAYLDRLIEWDADGVWASGTTYFPKGGMVTMRAAAGTVMEGLDAVLAGKAGKAYALVRPPSHHADRDVADGYCFLNCVGIAVEHARAAGCERVAVLDWDVHHGNGTQSGFYDRDDVLTISLHMNHGAWGPTHPQTGEVDETGTGAGKGYNVNLPLPMGSGDETYLAVMRDCVLPKLQAFQPDLIIVSNGHDAGQFDPNGRQLISMAGFHGLASLAAQAAGELCDGKLLAVQEGGYNIGHVGFCAYASALGFIGADLDLGDPLSYYPADGQRALDTVADLIARHPLFGG